ncbi:hypothetical protein [Candidatus Magnetomonas plexicatena]|uniref:hypothetical protein n=1 Tax=Candidatus Magnetomonas plexicatena TaxID=2552947 RepID=UPI001C73F391|nr:hypothetical protein E2O03_001720 [Nitrospirales bacterium LBB_01]
MKKIVHIGLIIAILALATISFADSFTLIEKSATGAAASQVLIKPLKDWTCQVTTSKVADNATVALEGSVTGEYFGKMVKYDLTASDLSEKTAFFSVTGIPVKYVRGNLLNNPDNATIKMSCIGTE